MSEDINEELGLPKGYKIGIKDAIKILERFSVATFGSEKPISDISFIYYFDMYGDFTKKNNHFNVIVNDMFDNLPYKSQLELTKYLFPED